MQNNYLWVFVFSNSNELPFPLFWSNRNIGCCTIDELDTETKSKIEYLFSDNEKGLTPKDGVIMSWSHLHLLDDESLLSTM